MLLSPQSFAYPGPIQIEFPAKDNAVNSPDSKFDEIAVEFRSLSRTSQTSQQEPGSSNIGSCHESQVRILLKTSFSDSLVVLQIYILRCLCDSVHNYELCEL